LGAACTIILIIADYSRKYNTDTVQRRLFLAMLVSTLAAVLSSFAENMLAGRPGLSVHCWLYAIHSVFLAAQNITLYVSFVFIDYFACKSEERTGRILRLLAVFMAVYVLSVLANLPLGYYFSISAGNYYVPANFYLLRLCISYFPLLLAFADVFMRGEGLLSFAAGKFKRVHPGPIFCESGAPWSSAPDVVISEVRFRQPQVFLLIALGVLTASGAGLDIVFRTSSLIWSCYTAALLYFYFFIIQSDSRIDTLTGIGNRFSFNEFITKLSRQGAKDSYAIIMIDMDYFKEINDTFGHLEGDNALRDMASIIKGRIRETDFAVRYGGDEFILAVNAETDIEKLMERIHHAMDHQNEKARRPYKLLMSYGWDVFSPGSNLSIEEFLIHIDKLMYTQKMSKRTAGRLPGPGEAAVNHAVNKSGGAHA
jgi:diguanylate cyclase (GGDEF)-like protein